MVAEISYEYVRNRWGGQTLRRVYKEATNPFYGKHHTEETRKILSIKAKERPPETYTYRQNPEYRYKLSQAVKGKLKGRKFPGKGNHRLGCRHTEETKQKIAKANRNKIVSLETRAKLSKAMKGRTPPPFSKEHRRKIGEANHRRWQRPGFAEKVLAKIRNSSSIKPNKCEMLLESILNQYFPNEWKYVGDGNVIIAGKNPDFINSNSKKLIIELFGDYWHTDDDEDIKRELYSRYGFRSLFIWQSELPDLKEVVNRIREFMNE